MSHGDVWFVLQRVHSSVVTTQSAVSAAAAPKGSDKCENFDNSLKMTKSAHGLQTCDKMYADCLAAAQAAGWCAGDD
eukprot:scaffold89351_cov33-Prasinocladus_malaysianus.AAC.1